MLQCTCRSPFFVIAPFKTILQACRVAVLAEIYSCLFSFSFLSSPSPSCSPSSSILSFSASSEIGQVGSPLQSRDAIPVYFESSPSVFPFCGREYDSMCLPKQGAEMSEPLEAQRGASGVLLHHFGPGLFTGDCVWHLNSPFALHAGLQTMSSLSWHARVNSRTNDVGG